MWGVQQKHPSVPMQYFVEKDISMTGQETALLAHPHVETKYAGRMMAAEIPAVLVQVALISPVP